MIDFNITNVFMRRDGFKCADNLPQRRGGLYGRPIIQGAHKGLLL
jgi:hypothetical protein